MTNSDVNQANITNPGNASLANVLRDPFVTVHESESRKIENPGATHFSANASEPGLQA